MEHFGFGFFPIKIAFFSLCFKIFGSLTDYPCVKVLAFLTKKVFQKNLFQFKLAADIFMVDSFFLSSFNHIHLEIKYYHHQELIYFREPEKKLNITLNRDK